MLPASVAGQTMDTTVVEKDTIRNKFLPSGLRIGTDIISHAKSQFQNNFNGWEVQADVDFGRYFLVGEYGTWGRTFQPENGLYSNDGTYWRAGVDVNFLLKDPERNMFFLGARYGRSKFSEQYNITMMDSVWGSFTQTYVNTNVPARWLELTAGLKVKIWKMIWMGYTGRFKFGLKHGHTPTMLPHDIPGYGRTHRETTWGFNYYIFIRIPFRKLPEIPEKK